MNWQMVGLIVVGYLLLRQYASGQGSLLGGGGGDTTGASGGGPVQPAGPTAAQLQQCAQAGGVWDYTAGHCVPANVVTSHTDPTSIAQRLLQAANAAGYGSNPILTYDQWNWFAVNRLTPALTPPDFTSVAPRDSAGATPSVSALQYAQNFVAISAGMHGVRGFAGLGRVVQMRPAGPSKWTM